MHSARKLSIGVVGGGPAGAFFAIQTLLASGQNGQSASVTVFEHPHLNPRCEALCSDASYRGCPYCAGGLSPRLLDALASIGITIPANIVGARVREVVIHGQWKNFLIDVPDDRLLLGVFRGRRPPRRASQLECFDAFLLDHAQRLGADVIDALVYDARYSVEGKPVILFQRDGERCETQFDFVVFAGGMNQEPTPFAGDNRTVDILRRLNPHYRPPKTRKAIIFEISTDNSNGWKKRDQLHFFHIADDDLQLNMCSIIPKSEYLTVTLIGNSIDRAKNKQEKMDIIKAFLAHRSVSAVVPAIAPSRIHCICYPEIVVGAATHVHGNRVAAVGDMAISRLYKDGILSAYLTSSALSNALGRFGVESSRVSKSYNECLRRLNRDIWSGRIVFRLYNVIFSRSALSRILYQTFISELKLMPGKKRRIEKIIWGIASGDADYLNILASMLHPTTVLHIIRHGVMTTLRNVLLEAFFGLHWGNISRHPTGVRLELARIRRAELLSLLESGRFDAQAKFDFEAMYTIYINTDANSLFDALGKFGDEDRRWLNPRWVKIRRRSGEPNQLGSIVGYRFFGKLVRFDLHLVKVVPGRLLVYRVVGGFAEGGILMFFLDETLPTGYTIYMALKEFRGRTIRSKLTAYLFRWALTSGVHEVLWNHALCELKSAVEGQPTVDQRLKITQVLY